MTSSDADALPLLDSNTIVRVLVEEPAAQYAAAARLIGTVANASLAVIVEDVIVAEVVWTLKSFYGWTRPRIAAALTEIVDLPGVHNADKPTLRRALALYGSRAIDFADALLAARALTRGGAVISFDRDFDRI